MSLTIYIAGSSKNRGRAREMIDAVELMGYVVTFDWVNGIDQIYEKHVADNDSGVPHQLQAWSAWRDMAAVSQANIVWQLLEDRGRGSWMERGAAMSWPTKFLMTSGMEGARGGIFNTRVNAHFDTDEEALEFLRFTGSLE